MLSGSVHLRDTVVAVVFVAFRPVTGGGGVVSDDGGVVIVRVVGAA